MTTKIIYTLSLLSVLFCSPALGQGLTAKVVSGIYSNNDFVNNLTEDQAFLSYTIYPNATVSNATVITYKDILSNNYNLSGYNSYRRYGRVKIVDDVQYCISLIDSDYFYVSEDASYIESFVLPSLNLQLADRGLSTSNQRSAFILALNNQGFGIRPVNFLNYLRDWIIAGIVIFLAVPFWFILRRFLRG